MIRRFAARDTCPGRSAGTGVESSHHIKQQGDECNGQQTAVHHFDLIVARVPRHNREYSVDTNGGQIKRERPLEWHQSDSLELLDVRAKRQSAQEYRHQHIDDECKCDQPPCNQTRHQEHRHESHHGQRKDWARNRGDRGVPVLAERVVLLVNHKEVEVLETSNRDQQGR